MGAIHRVLRSFPFAFSGVATIARTQPNFRVHLVLAACAIACGVWLQLGTSELALLALTIGLVLSAEAMNTAVESVCDVVSPTYHPLIRRTKDAAAGAVLISALAALAVAGMLFLPPLLALVGRP